MNEKRSYYAIIPANVRYDERLIPNAKLLYGEITALCNEKGYCWAGNEYFSNLYGVSKETVSRWISDLIKCGYIQREMIYKEGTRQIINRYIRINQYPIDELINTPIDEKVKDNNTYINNTINNTMSSCEQHDCVPYKEIIEYLNTKANSSYKHTTAATQKCIKARWNEGFRLDDFKRVVDNKIEDWINDEKFSKFLRPQTLFSNKFEGYLNEKPAKQSNKQVANNQYSNKNIVINKPLGIREQEQYLDEDELRIRRIIQEESSND